MTSVLGLTPSGWQAFGELRAIEWPRRVHRGAKRGSSARLLRRHGRRRSPSRAPWNGRGECTTVGHRGRSRERPTTAAHGADGHEMARGEPPLPARRSSAARPPRRRGDRHSLRAARVIGRLAARPEPRSLESPRCPPTNHELSDNCPVTATLLLPLGLLGDIGRRPARRLARVTGEGRRPAYATVGRLCASSVRMERRRE